MDFCRNVPVSGGLPPGHPSKQDPLPAYSTIGCLTSPLDDLFPGENTEDLEWLSMLVEDCLSGSGNCIPAPKNVQSNPTSQPSKSSQRQQQNPSLPEFVIPGKARSKRKRAPSVTKTTPSSSFSDYPDPQNKLLHVTTSDPPLLQQAYWLADSELIIPRKVNNISKDNEDEEEEGTEEKMVVDKHNSSGNLEGSPGQPRRCTHCLAQRTPQWRAGPLGPKTLCNACGVRFKSGRLLPEYRPAKSPTFVSYKHSNSHKKVMEMRMSILSSVPTSQ